MTWIQRFFLRILPKGMAREMEMHSRSWVMQCPHCENEVSYWDMGGIRWRATGNQRNFAGCRACGKTGWQRSYRKQEVPVPLERDADRIEVPKQLENNADFLDEPFSLEPDNDLVEKL